MTLKGIITAVVILMLIGSLGFIGALSFVVKVVIVLSALGLLIWLFD